MAYARVGLYRFKPGSLDPLLEKGRVELPALMRRQPGLRRYGVMRPGSDDIISLSAFATAEQAGAASQALLVWVRENFGDNLVSAQNHVGEIGVYAETSPTAEAKYGRVALYQFQPGGAGEVIRRAAEGFAPLLAAQPGFVRYVVVDNGDGTGVSYSGWASLEQAEATVQSAATWVRENLASLAAVQSNHVGEMLWSVGPD
jgi:hypothetical protein